MSASAPPTRGYALKRVPTMMLGASYYHSYGGETEGDAPVVQIFNVKILRDSKILSEDLWIQNGRIIDPQMRFFKLKKGADIRIDGKGCTISPGFIDLQLNGGFGMDFSTIADIDNGAIQKVAKNLLQYGVTSFVPTLITSEPSTYAQILPKIIPTPGTPEGGAEVIGVHLEGPFLSEHKYGAHKKDFVQKSVKTLEDFQDVYGGGANVFDNVRIITLAPELEGLVDIIPELVDRGIIVSAGHSMATINQAERAVGRGLSLITHLFNAMVPFHHRDPGLVGLLGTHNPIFFSMIVDNVHSHPASVKIAYKAHPQGFCLITDSIGAMGLPEGSSVQLGPLPVEVKQGKAYITGTDTLAGSIVTMDDAVRNFKESTGCSLVDALEAATLHPAQALGITQFKGTLGYGSDADFVLLDDKLEIQATFITGMCAYAKPGFIQPELAQQLSQVHSMNR